ncbi:MAG: hypothetical protein IJP20_03845 [Clostridia bacterium]|nr:hypothetical protein [Clostridia bacterium]
MKKKITKMGEASWVVGNILCAIGNCLVSKSAFGLSAIIAPAFIMHEKIGFLSVGVCEYIIQGLLLSLCCILIGRFKGKFIATICNILFYGACFDIVNALLAPIVPVGMISRISAAAIGTLITGFAIALMLRTYIPPSAYEIFVKEVSDAKGIELSRMKLVFDGSMLALSILMMLLLLGEFRFDMIGALTVISAFLNSVLIGFFGRILDKYCDFSPAIPKLYNLLNPNSKK